MIIKNEDEEKLNLYKKILESNFNSDFEKNLKINNIIIILKKY